MKYLAVVVALLFVPVVSSSQTLTNETMKARIRAERADKVITLTFDPVGKTSKLMAVSDNFVSSEASNAGVLAMNFAIGVIYPGAEMKTQPDTFQLTFWVLTRKPRFSGDHDLTVVLSDEMLVIGSGRYVSKPRDEIEYLNYEISRENLAKIAAQSETRFKLGDFDFTFTRSQMKLFADLLAVTSSDPVAN